MLTELAGAKSFAVKLKLKTFMKQLNRFTKLVSGAAACPTHHYGIVTQKPYVARSLSLVLVIYENSSFQGHKLVHW